MCIYYIYRKYQSSIYLLMHYVVFDYDEGTNPDTNEPTVGFRISSYKEGSVSVGPILGLKNVNQQMKKVVKVLQINY